MIRLPLMPSSLLLIVSTFGTLQAHPKEPDVSFLSADAKAVLDQTKALHEKIHEKIEATEDESSIRAFKEIGRSLHESCLIGRGPGRGGPGRHEGKEGKERKGPGPLSDEQKQEFATKLKSEACSQAIASAQSKLQ